MSNGGEHSKDGAIIKVSVWVVILLILGTFGWFFATALSHAERIRAVEEIQKTEQKYIAQSLYDMKEYMQEIRDEVRAMCFLTLISGIGWIFMVRLNSALTQYDVVIFGLFMVAAFAPKAVQKFAEMKIGG